VNRKNRVVTVRVSRKQRERKKKREKGKGILVFKGGSRVEMERPGGGIKQTPGNHEKSINDQEE